MALTRTDSNPVRSETIPNGWAFDMRDENGSSVRVIVTDLALEALGSADSAETFLAYHSNIEQLASVKHSAGQIEKDGTIKVTSADVRAAGLAVE